LARHLSLFLPRAPFAKPDLFCQRHRRSTFFICAPFAPRYRSITPRCPVARVLLRWPFFLPASLAQRSPHVVPAPPFCCHSQRLSSQVNRRLFCISFTGMVGITEYFTILPNLQDESFLSEPGRAVIQSRRIAYEHPPWSPAVGCLNPFLHVVPACFASLRASPPPPSDVCFFPLETAYSSRKYSGPLPTPRNLVIRYREFPILELSLMDLRIFHLNIFTLSILLFRIGLRRTRGGAGRGTGLPGPGCPFLCHILVVSHLSTIPPGLTQAIRVCLVPSPSLDVLGFPDHASCRRFPRSTRLRLCLRHDPVRTPGLTRETRTVPSAFPSRQSLGSFVLEPPKF